MTRHSIIGLSLCLACLALGCREAGDPSSMNVVLRGDPATKALVARTLKEDPELAVPGTETKYSVTVVTPEAGVDYKILRVTRNPRVGYNIIVVDPTSGKERADLSAKLGDALRQRLRQQFKR